MDPVLAHMMLQSTWRAHGEHAWAPLPVTMDATGGMAAGGSGCPRSLETPPPRRVFGARYQTTTARRTAMRGGRTTSPSRDRPVPLGPLQGSSRRVHRWACACLRCLRPPDRRLRCNSGHHRRRRCRKDQCWPRSAQVAGACAGHLLLHQASPSRLRCRP